MKDLKGTAISVKPPLMATVFRSSIVTFFLFVFCLFVCLTVFFQSLLMVLLVKMVEQVLAKQSCSIPKEKCYTSQSIFPYWPFSKRLLQLCSQLQAGFRFCKCLFDFIKYVIFK